jgi:hypothetical protein
VSDDDSGKPPAERAKNMFEPPLKYHILRMIDEGNVDLELTRDVYDGTIVFRLSGKIDARVLLDAPPNLRFKLPQHSPADEDDENELRAEAATLAEKKEDK